MQATPVALADFIIYRFSVAHPKKKKTKQEMV